MGAAAAEVAERRVTAAELPAHVRRMAAPQQIGWLDSAEACVVFPGRKTRHRLRLSIITILAILDRRGRDGYSLSPAASKLLDEMDTPGGAIHHDYPRQFVNERSRLFPDRRCACDACHGKAWPYPHCGSAGPQRWQWISYECHTLADSEVLATDPRPTLTERDAMDLGLTIKASRARVTEEPEEMVPGCQRCGRMRRKGDRYCAVCAKAARREMVRGGYLRH